MVATVPEVQPLYIGTKLNLGDRVLGEGEKNSFTALPGEGGHRGPNALKTVCPDLESMRLDI